MHLSGALGVALRQIPSSFAPSKLRRGFSCAPKMRSLRCIFCIKQTADSAFLYALHPSRYLCFLHQANCGIALSFGTKIPPFSAFFIYRLWSQGAREGKQGKQGKQEFLSLLFLLSLLSLLLLPLFTGIFFDTCAVGVPKTRTSHRRRESDRFGGRGWRESQRREKTKTANALPAKHSF